MNCAYSVFGQFRKDLRATDLDFGDIVEVLRIAEWVMGPVECVGSFELKRDLNRVIVALYECENEEKRGAQMITVSIQAVGEWVKCDVCSLRLQRSLAHTAGALNLTALYGEIGGVEVGLIDADGLWCLCDACYALLVAGDVPGLVSRAMSNLAEVGVSDLSNDAEVKILEGLFTEQFSLLRTVQ